MKKTVFTAAALLLSAGLILSSCKKKEEEDPTTSSTGSVSGMAYANLDETNDTLPDGTPQIQWETAPAGTKVVARIDPADFSNNPDNSVNYENITYETEIDGSGAFAFDSIKAYGTNVDVELIFSDFGYDTQVYGVDTGSNQIKTTMRNVYQVPNMNVNVVANNTKVVDVTYN